MIRKTHLIVILTFLLIGFFYYLFYYTKLTCLSCGGQGYSDNIDNSIDKKVFTKQFSNFRILTDSLAYIKLNDKILYLEKKHRNGERIPKNITVSLDKNGNRYQFRISPASGDHLKSQHHLYCVGDFVEIPDTVHCEIWSYAVNGSKSNKIGIAIVY